MAAAKSLDADDEVTQAAPPAKSKKGGLILIVVLAVLLSAGAAGGVAWFIANNMVHSLKAGEGGEEVEGEEAEPEEPKGPANYYALDPAFVVNIGSERSQRFLQVQVEVMSRKPEMIEHVQHHTPRIRSALLLLLGSVQAEELASREGKEKLQADVLAEIQKIVLEETGESGIDAVYFTSFVMQ